RALVAMQVLEVEPVSRRVALDVGPRLDLDHVGAHLGELAHRGRARAGTGEIQDGIGREGKVVHGRKHTESRVGGQRPRWGSGRHRRPPASATASGSARSRAIAVTPNSGPAASTANVHRQPMAWTSDGTIQMETIVMANPMQVCVVSAVPTYAGGDS